MASSRKRAKPSGGGTGGLYQTAGRVLNTVWENQGRSLKSVVYDKAGNLTVSTAVYALCTKVLQQERTLTAVLLDADGTQQIRNKGVWYATLYDTLTRPEGLPRGYGGAVARYMKQNATTLQHAWQRQQNTALSFSPNTKDTTATTTTRIHPRYVRVNTLRTTTQAVQTLWKTHHVLADDDCDNNVIQIDPHIPDLLVLPAASTASLLQFAQTQAQYRSHWILQDKSSCFSAYCLVHGFGTSTPEKRVYLDACAAPGNKTTHLAALVAPQLQMASSSPPTQIYALDRSPTRFASLRNRVAAYVPATAAVQVQCACQDFLQTYGTASNSNAGSDDYDTVTDILLDPSCSGSGMPGRQTTDEDDDSNENRLASLQAFQVTALRHALTAFVNVQRVVYSTCSIHTVENEAVVAQVLAQCQDTWELVAPQCLQYWPRRGLATDGLTASQATMLIRVDPTVDDTHGFFVACFQRRRPSSEEGTKTKAVADAAVATTSPPPQQQQQQAMLQTNKPERMGTHQADAPKKAKRRKAKVHTDDSSSAAKRPPAWVQQSGKKKKRRR